MFSDCGRAPSRELSWRGGGAAHVLRLDASSWAVYVVEATRNRQPLAYAKPALVMTLGVQSVNLYC